MRFAPVIAAFVGVCGLVATYSIDPITGPAAWATSTAVRAYQAAIQSTQPAEHEAPVFGSDEPVFRYASIQRGSIEQTVTVTGALQPVKTIEVGSQLSGQLSKVYVDFNDPVRKDQPLAQIDPRTFAAKVDEAKAVLQTALAYVDLEKAKLDRAKVDLETAKGNKAVLAAKLESAQAVKTSAQKTLQRKLTLQSQNVVATTTVEDAQTDFTARLAQEHEAEILMSLNSYSVEGAQADVRRIEAELQQARTARSSALRLMASSSADLSTKGRRSRSALNLVRPSWWHTASKTWRSTRRSMKRISDASQAASEPILPWIPIPIVASRRWFGKYARHRRTSKTWSPTPSSSRPPISMARCCLE
jgi:HlyD family secretion protein